MQPAAQRVLFASGTMLFRSVLVAFFLACLWDEYTQLWSSYRKGGRPMTIRAKLLALLAVFILMTSLIISFMAYRSYKDSLALTATDGKALAISLANYVTAFMKTAAEYEQMVSSMPVIARGAGHLPTNLNPDAPYSLKGLSPEAADLLAAMKRAKDASPRFLEIGFVDEGGGILVYPADPPAGQDFRQRPWYTAAMRSPSQTALSIYKSMMTGNSVCSFSRVIKQNGTPVGVLYLEVSLQFITDRLKSMQTGKTGRLIVVDANDIVIASANTKVLMTKVGDVPDEPIAILGKLPAGAHLVEIAGSMRQAVIHVDAQGWKYIYTAETSELLESTYVVLIECCIGAFLGLLFVVLLGLYILRVLNRQLHLLQNTTRTIAGGDINADLPEERLFSGELLDLYKNFSSMVGTIRETLKIAQKNETAAHEQSQRAREAMEKAHAASEEALAKTNALLAVADKLEAVGDAVASASTQLSAQIEQSDRGSAEAAARLSDAAAAMNEMNASVQEVARNASVASTASAETKEKAEAGARVVERSLHRIESVYQASLEVKKDMGQLNEHTQSISVIMGVISDIADQTNLLALNAAIEAARAGEAGRGFAVVADEVRKLAEKTMISTQDVSKAICAIQESTGKSTAAVDRAMNQIEEATQLARDSGQALEAIVSTVEAAADQVHTIATASEEQSAASEEINQSILRCNDMSKQIADAMSEASKAVSGLAVQLQELNKLIQNLKRA